MESVYENYTSTVETVVTFDSAKRAKAAEILARFEQEISATLSGYTYMEALTFGVQEAEARAYTADNNADTPMLSELATNRGIPLQTLCEKVIEKADAFKVVAGAALGKRQALEDQLQSLNEADDTIDDINSIEWL